jgi:hypothetical protein
MGVFSNQLRALARSGLSVEQWSALTTGVQLDPLDIHALADFDDTIDGPSMRRVNSGHGGPGTLGIAGYGKGAYELADREVFRGLHYCGSYLHNSSAAGLMRPLVLDGGAHLEALLKRMTGRSRWHLGRLAGHAEVRGRLGAETAARLYSYAEINNAAKHPYGLIPDGHMFSVKDGLYAYFAVRMLALEIYPVLQMVTDWRHLDRAGAKQII